MRLQKLTLFHSKKIWFALLLIGSLISLLLVFIFFPNKFLSWPGKFLPVAKSRVELSLEEKILNLKFTINPQDEAGLLVFNQKLGISEDWTKGISLELDESITSQIGSSFPNQLKLNFQDNKLEFSSDGLSYGNPLSSKTFSLATNSASFQVNAKSAQDFTIDIFDPNQVVYLATNSGKLRLADQANLIFPILSRIARINVRMQNKVVNGYIQLK